jgi:hypothetical protein
MYEASSSEKAVYFCYIKCCHVSEGGVYHSQRPENFKSYTTLRGNRFDIDTVPRTQESRLHKGHKSL